MLHSPDVPTNAPLRESAREGDLAMKILDATARELIAPVWALGVASSELRRPPELSPRERQILDLLGVHVHRIARVLTGVLDYVHAESEGALPVDARPCHLDEVCDAAVEELRDGGFDGRISREGEGDGEGEWDSARLAQAIAYLLELAAANAAPGEPVRLRWRGDAEEVVVRVEAAGGELPRIEPEWGDALGEDGGLKAFLARRIALAHGGELARFARNRVTSHVMVLPRAAPEDAGPPAG